MDKKQSSPFDDFLRAFLASTERVIEISEDGDNGRQANPSGYHSKIYSGPDNSIMHEFTIPKIRQYGILTSTDLPKKLVGADLYIAREQDRIWQDHGSHLPKIGPLDRFTREYCEEMAPDKILEAIKAKKENFRVSFDYEKALQAEQFQKFLSLFKDKSEVRLKEGSLNEIYLLTKSHLIWGHGSSDHCISADLLYRKADTDVIFKMGIHADPMAKEEAESYMTHLRHLALYHTGEVKHPPGHPSRHDLQKK